MLYIFDLDGTLTDTLRAIAHFGNTALMKNGFAAIEVDKYRYLVGDGRDVLIHRMLSEYDADTEENYIRVGKDYDIEYNGNMLYLTKPYDGIIDALKEISKKHTLAVLSNKPDNIVKYIVDTLFPHELFKSVDGQKSGIPTKPSPIGAFEIAHRLGFEPKECVFIGDTNVDIYTGKNAGMKTVGVLWGFRDREELEQAGADIIIEKTEQLVDVL